MSQENVELVRRGIDTWNMGDLDAFADLFEVDAEVITDPSWMEPGPFKGRAVIRRWFEGLAESWDGRDEIVLRDLFEVGDQVVARFRLGGSWASQPASTRSST